MTMTKADGYEKTGFVMLVCVTTYKPIYRSVYQKNGRYYVSYDGEVRDVTFNKEKFVQKNIF